MGHSLGIVVISFVITFTFEKNGFASIPDVGLFAALITCFGSFSFRVPSFFMSIVNEVYGQQILNMIEGQGF